MMGQTPALEIHSPASSVRSTTRSRWSAALLVIGCCALAVPHLRADTIFLKDGTQILDCKVTSETETHVYVRTPKGDMQVPRTAIHRIQRVKTVYDTYSEQLASIREGDINGYYKLAIWCRRTDGLRKESDELLEKVIASSENHVQARRLLGHLRIDGEWVVPKPLGLELKVSTPHANDLRTQLDLFLKSRKDVRLLPEKSPASPGAASGSGEDNPLEKCTVEASVVVSRKAGTRFYGKTMGQATFGATVRLQAKSPWIGRTGLQASLDGQIPGNGADTALGVQNALGRNSAYLHRFLDQLTERRARLLEAELRKQARAKPRKES